MGAEGDTFPEGTIIRWCSSGRYTYAALKAAGKWYTTAQRGNTFMPQVMSWSELLQALSRNETSQVEIATAWRSVTDSAVTAAVEKMGTS